MPKSKKKIIYLIAILEKYKNITKKHDNGAAPLAMPRRWRTVLKKQQAEKIP
jgi:hypothetical protein